MGIFRVAFFGHRQIDNILIVEDRLYSLVIDLMKNTAIPYNKISNFLVGRGIAPAEKRCLAFSDLTQRVDNRFAGNSKGAEPLLWERIHKGRHRASPYAVLSSVSVRTETDTPRKTNDLHKQKFNIPSPATQKLSNIY